MKHILSYPHVAQRLFNSPLMIAQGKLDAILAAAAARFELPVDAQEMGGRRSERRYEVTPDGVAIIPVTGTLVRRSAGLAAWSGMRSYAAIKDEVLDAATDPGVRGILLEMDSPGGEAGGLPDLMDVLVEARELKPLWAVANDDAFSAAYGIASAAERIFVTRTGGVGSVGVIAVHLDHSEADSKEGLSYTIFRGGRFKAEHNSLEPLTDHAKVTLQAEIDRLYGIFAGGVAENRSMSTEAVLKTEAQLFFGENAVDVGFADQVGTIEDAHLALVDHINGAENKSLTQLQSTTRETVALHTSQEGEPMTAKTEQPAATAEAAAETTEVTTELAATAAPDTQILDLQKEAEKRGRDQALSYAKEVRELCRLAGKPDLAESFIDRAVRDRKMSTDAVRKALIDLQAEEDDAAEIVSTHETTVGGSGGVDMHQVHQDAYARLAKAGG